ncbi:MAG: hypothetical protein U1E25_12355 [Methylocystis sp.]
MAQETAGDKPASAAVLVIGDEILSGRTQDVNTWHRELPCADRRVDLLEARVVRDAYGGDRRGAERSFAPATPMSSPHRRHRSDP